MFSADTESDSPYTTEQVIDRSFKFNLIRPAVIQMLVEGQPLLSPGFASSGQ